MRFDTYCIDQSLSLWEGLTRISQNPAIDPRGKELKHRFDELVETLENLGTIESLKELVEKLVGHVQRHQGVDLAEVRGFLAEIVEQEKLTQAQKLVFALQTFDLKAETQLQANAIRIMTMHKAKGLSSELVIIPALEDDLVPGADGEEIARRLMYVSMTCSRRTLIMTHAYNRPGAQSYLGTGGGEWQRQRSRFLDELKIRSEGGEPFAAGLPDRLRRTQPISQIGSSSLRQLLIESFSDEDLISRFANP